MVFSIFLPRTFNDLLWILSFFSWSIILNIISGLITSRPFKKAFCFYPFFEWFMTVCFFGILHNKIYFWPYFFLFSALGITIQTDLTHMVISRFVSLYLAPTGVILSAFGFLPLCWAESLIASVIGYLFFYTINKIFFFIKKQDGLGQGDIDLMALIGAYTGLLGIWFSILFGSFVGMLAALYVMSRKKTSLTCLPFGPSLALATIIFVLLKNQIIVYLI